MIFHQDRKENLFQKDFNCDEVAAASITSFMLVDKIRHIKPFLKLSVACNLYEEEAEWSQFATYGSLLEKWLLSLHSSAFFTAPLLIN